MAKLKGIILSLGAHGTIGDSVTFQQRKGTKVARKKPIPTDTKSLAQLSWRHMYQKAVALWHALSAAEKQEWNHLAVPHHMPGYAYFLSQALKPNPGLYLPLQGGTMAGNIDMAKHRILKLPVPTDDQEAASKSYVDTSIPPGVGDYPKKLKYPTGEIWGTPGWMNFDYIGTSTQTGILYHIPIFVTETTTYIRIAIKVAVAKADKLARLGIYAWTNGVPDALILDAGTVSLTDTILKELVISQQLTRGYYFLSFVCDSNPNLVAIDPSEPYMPPVESFGPALDDSYYTILSTTGRIGDVAGGLPDPAPTVNAIWYSELAVFLREQ